MTNEKFKTAFAERLKALRKSRKLTQKQLGLLCGYPDNSAENAIQNWEYGTRMPRIDKIRPLATALECSLDDLIP